jgi:hypothetical protein
MSAYWLVDPQRPFAKNMPSKRAKSWVLAAGESWSIAPRSASWALEECILFKKKKKKNC